MLTNLQLWQAIFVTLCSDRDFHLLEYIGTMCAGQSDDVPAGRNVGSLQ